MRIAPAACVIHSAEPALLADRLLTAPPAAPESEPFGSGVLFTTDTEEIVARYAKHASHGDAQAPLEIYLTPYLISGRLE